MKKYITIAALFAAGTAFANAEDVTLRYLLDFNTLGGSGAVLENKSSAPGETGMTQDGYVNYASGTMDGSDYAHPGSKSNWKIQSDSGIGNGSGEVLSSASGFTIVFNGYAAETSNWGDFISFTVGSESYKFEINGGNGLNIYTGTDQSTAAAQISGVNRNTWYNYAISVYGSDYVLTVINTSGNIVGTSRFTGSTGNLTLIQDVSSFEAHPKGGSKIDNVAVYDGVLTSENLAMLTKSQVAGIGTIQVIPEPSAFGLLAGLGALVAVSSRRRRR